MVFYGLCNYESCREKVNEKSGFKQTKVLIKNEKKQQANLEMLKKIRPVKLIAQIVICYRWIIIITATPTTQ